MKNKDTYGAFVSRSTNRAAAMKLGGSESHRQVAGTIAMQAITIVQNRNGILPLDIKTSALVISSSNILSNLLRERCANSTSATIPTEPNISDSLPQLTLKAEESSVVIAAIVNHQQAKLIQQLSTMTQTPIIVIGMGSPYSLRYCPNVAVSLATYDEHYASVLAAVNVIVGESSALGTLPIRLEQNDQ